MHLLGFQLDINTRNKVKLLQVSRFGDFLHTYHEFLYKPSTTVPSSTAFSLFIFLHFLLFPILEQYKCKYLLFKCKSFLPF